MPGPDYSYIMEFYFASILLEKNRWTEDKNPAYSPADWAERISGNGFHGLELWENHAYAATAEELGILKKTFSTILFNTYADFSDKSSDHLEKASRMIRDTGAAGCKFNFGNRKDKESEYLENFREWSREFPSDFRFLCECHGNTLMENPYEAGRLLDLMDVPGVEVIIHAQIEPVRAERWFDALGPRITHCHLNLFGLNDNLRNQITADNLSNTIRQIGHSNVRTVSLEFTEGVGEESEDMETLFASALNDRAYFRSVLASGLSKS